MSEYISKADATGSVAEKCAGLSDDVLLEIVGTLVFAWLPITIPLEKNLHNAFFCCGAKADALANGHTLVRIIEHQGKLGTYTGDLASKMSRDKVLNWRRSQGSSVAKPRDGEMVVAQWGTLNGDEAEVREQQTWLLPRVWQCHRCGRRVRRDVHCNEYEHVDDAWWFVGVSKHATCCSVCLGGLKDALLATEEAINAAEGTRLSSGAKWRR